MNENDTKRAVVEVLQQIQEQSGRSMKELSKSDAPIGVLPGFDSLNGVEATLDLEDRLGVDSGGRNLFISEDGLKALSVGEIVQRVRELVVSK